jgi:hypothetical protein
MLNEIASPKRVRKIMALIMIQGNTLREAADRRGNLMVLVKSRKNNPAIQKSLTQRPAPS